MIKGITSDKALYISNEYHKITGVNEVIKFLGEYNFRTCPRNKRMVCI